MLFTSQVLIFIGLFLQSAVTAFNFNTDSCVPGLYDRVSVTRRSKCSMRAIPSGSLDISCDQGLIFLDLPKNTMTVILGASQRALTVHGACFVNGGQAAHFDLHVASPAGKRYIHNFNAFNRKCIGATSLDFQSYVLTPPELEQCATAPISPIS